MEANLKHKYFLFEIDKSGAEWVVVAYMCRDKEMLRIIENNLDPHLETAHLMTGIARKTIIAEDKLLSHTRDRTEIIEGRRRLVEEGFDELNGSRWIPENQSIRQGGKTSDLAFNYDMSPEGYSLKYEVSLPDSRAFHKSYHQIYLGVKQTYHSEIDFALKTTRTILTPAGAKWKFLGPIDSHVQRLFYAFPPQQTVAYMTNQGLIYAYENLPKIKLLAQIHDAILGEYPIQEASAFPQDITDLDKAVSPEFEWKGNSFSVKSEVKIGLNWGGWKKDNPKGMRKIRIGESVEEVLKEMI